MVLIEKAGLSSEHQDFTPIEGPAMVTAHIGAMGRQFFLGDGEKVVSQEFLDQDGKKVLDDGGRVTFQLVVEGVSGEIRKIL